MQLGCGAVRDTEASGGHVGTGTCLNLSSCLCAHREIWKARRDIRSSSVPSFFHRTSTATSAAPAHPVAPRRPRSKRDAGITTLHRRRPPLPATPLLPVALGTKTKKLLTESWSIFPSCRSYLGFIASKVNARLPMLMNANPALSILAHALARPSTAPDGCVCASRATALCSACAARCSRFCSG